MLGALFYLIAITRGKISTIVTLTALYPLISIALAWMVLKEPITLKEGVGMVLALIAIVLLAT
jgi:transporter family protein